MAKVVKGLKARQEFLRYLFKHLGGVTKIAKAFGKNKQLAENWIQRGGVPWVLARQFAETFEVGKIETNFLDACYWYGDNLDWEGLVKQSRLSNLEQAKVLSYEFPEVPSDALWG